ncbi:MAG: type I toxin-antitoxin system Fst family toxin [Weeksellaceae bacterium]|nr:type I toxin-antitoxin system Fst family toxin [Weeksellaceae bacterium]
MLYMFQQIFTLIVAPLFVGLVIELVSHWLDEKDDD